MEQLIAFSILMVVIGLIFVVSDLVYNRWVKKPEHEEFNKQQFDAMNDENFGDML